MRRSVEIVGWGLYLASSWTWCIGMFLPILLLRWWGWPGFVAFAVPNILGCIAFGYVFTPETSRRFVARFAPSIRWFAWVTIAFQSWFGSWADRRLGMQGLLGTSVNWSDLCRLLPLLFLMFPGTGRFWMIAGTACTIASFALFATHGLGALTDTPVVGSMTPMSLAWAAPFMAFGFLLCPALDPTFHRALQQSPSRHSFAVFGVAFAAQLLFAASTFNAATGLLFLAWPIAAQIILQTTFTMCAMVSVTSPTSIRSWSTAPAWILRSTSRASFINFASVLALPVVGMALGRFVLDLLTAITVDVPVMMPASELLASVSSVTSAGEATYLRWLGFYGIIFPAWLLLKLRRVPASVAWPAIFVAAAAAERGMVGARTSYLLVSLGVIVIAALWQSDNFMKEPEIAIEDGRSNA